MFFAGYANKPEAGHVLVWAVLAGGVAANRLLRARLEACAEAARMGFVAPPIGLCTDNGAMIAWAGVERLSRGLTDALDIAPRPRWPLEEMAGA